MLILTRRPDESIIVGKGGISFIIRNIKGNKVNIGIQASKCFAIYRNEIFYRIQAEQEQRDKAINKRNDNFQSQHDEGVDGEAAIINLIKHASKGDCMLTLERRPGEAIIIERGIITFTILGVKGNQARIGIQAPIDIPIHRNEIFDRIQAEQKPKIKSNHKENENGESRLDWDEDGNTDTNSETTEKTDSSLL